MKTRARAAIVVLTAAALTPVSAARAEDACTNDTTPPTVSNVSVTPTDVVVGKVRQSLTASFTASDDCEVATYFMSMTYSRVGDVSAGSFQFDGFKLVAGSAQSGTWQATEVLSDYQAPDRTRPAKLRFTTPG